MVLCTAYIILLIPAFDIYPTKILSLQYVVFELCDISDRPLSLLILGYFFWLSFLLHPYYIHKSFIFFSSVISMVLCPA